VDSHTSGQSYLPTAKYTRHENYGATGVRIRKDKIFSLFSTSVISLINVQTTQNDLIYHKSTIWHALEPF
jgi:hypothetical protein